MHPVDGNDIAPPWRPVRPVSVHIPRRCQFRNRVLDLVQPMARSVARRTGGRPSGPVTHSPGVYRRVTQMQQEFACM